MIWGFHVTALALALAFEDVSRARSLLAGLAERVDRLGQDERADQYPEWQPDLAQLLVLAGAYGLPLTGAEARLIQEQYLAGVAHYDRTVVWDPWDPALPEGESYPVLPDRNEVDAGGAVLRSHVRITEILDPFEYCASPLRASSGAQFVDCDVPTGGSSNSSWPTPAAVCEVAGH